jgi:2',3'-cyclic-nucleotide 2'-phosphodiesterase (5'-nucleotidase family)
VVRRCSSVALILTFTLALALPACGERLRIVYTNDLHVRLDRLASIERLVSTARARGDPVLLLDAGDAWQDFRVLLYAVWGGDRMVEWMNRVGYDAMAPGNHDFYRGWPGVPALAARAAFPLLCANLAPVDGTVNPFLASARVAVGGLDILIVGLTAFELLPTLDIPWLHAVDPVEALRRAIGAAPGEPDLVVCLAHIPTREAAAIAAAVPEVDIFVTGHSHETTATPHILGDALIVQSGEFGRNVGELLVDVDGGVVRFLNNVLVPTTEEAATDIGHGLLRLAQLAGTLALLVTILLF